MSLKEQWIIIKHVIEVRYQIMTNVSQTVTCKHSQVFLYISNYQCNYIGINEK